MRINCRHTAQAQQGYAGCVSCILYAKEMACILYTKEMACILYTKEMACILYTKEMACTNKLKDTTEDLMTSTVCISLEYVCLCQ